MCCFYQRQTQNCTVLLNWLVMVVENWLADAWAWWAENMACENAWDQADQEFWVQLLVLECENVKALWKQTTVLGRAVQARDNDYWVLDTILVLAVAFVLPTAWSPTLVLPAPWKPPNSSPSPWT
ncbi:hypothetical protein Y1Q_0021653 [Alligator mississippiensis]|uniref:Uncharacterized protein n=1 Tax=Alligator mississippiensis TaxID=8496 RepID=A0A151PAG1_ALLMI|nr:hypothetical protein Y1Q_0021653 [Alligator mississippiensis]